MLTRSFKAFLALTFLLAPPAIAGDVIFPENPAAALTLAQTRAPDVIRAKQEWLAWQAQASLLLKGPNPSLEAEGGYKEASSETGGATATGAFYGGQLGFVIETGGKARHRLDTHRARGRLLSLQYSNTMVALGAEAYGLFHQMQAGAMWLRELRWIQERQEQLLASARNLPRSSPQSRLEMVALEAQGREWANAVAQGLEAWWAQSERLAEICRTTNQVQPENWFAISWPPMPNKPPANQPPAWLEEKASLEKYLVSAEIGLARADLAPNLNLGALISASSAGSRELSAGGRVGLDLPMSRNSSGGKEYFMLREKNAGSEMELAFTLARQRWLAVARGWGRLEARDKTNPLENLTRLKRSLEGAERDVRLGTVSIPLYLEVARAYAQALGARKDLIQDAWSWHVRLANNFFAPSDLGVNP